LAEKKTLHRVKLILHEVFRATMMS